MLCRKPPKRYKLTPGFIRDLEQQIRVRKHEKRQWSGKPKTYADSTVMGFRVEVNQHSRSLKVQKDLRINRKCRTIRMTLGTTEQFTLREVRTWAMGIIAEIRAGRDPRGTKPDHATQHGN